MGARAARAAAAAAVLWDRQVVRVGQARQAKAITVVMPMLNLVAAAAVLELPGKQRQAQLLAERAVTVVLRVSTELPVHGPAVVAAAPTTHRHVAPAARAAAVPEQEPIRMGAKAQLEAQPIPVVVVAAAFRPCLFRVQVVQAS